MEQQKTLLFHKISLKETFMKKFKLHHLLLLASIVTCSYTLAQRQRSGALGPQTSLTTARTAKDQIYKDLSNAIEISDEKAIAKMFRANIALDINHKFSYKDGTITPLGLALRKKDLGLVNEILKLKPNLVVVQEDIAGTYSAVYLAIESQNPDIVKAILNYKPKPDLEKISNLPGKNLTSIELNRLKPDSESKRRIESSLKTAGARDKPLPKKVAIKKTGSFKTVAPSSPLPRKTSIVAPVKKPLSDLDRRNFNTTLDKNSALKKFLTNPKAKNKELLEALLKALQENETVFKALMDIKCTGETNVCVRILESIAWDKEKMATLIAKIKNKELDSGNLRDNLERIENL